jgi:hypothetical protein
MSLKHCGVSLGQPLKIFAIAITALLFFDPVVLVDSWIQRGKQAEHYGCFSQAAWVFQHEIRREIDANAEKHKHT